MKTTVKTKGLITIGCNLYKLNANDLKTLCSFLDKETVSYRGNKVMRDYADLEDFLRVIEEKYEPIATIFGYY